jgi:predicted secreted hydrolase
MFYRLRRRDGTADPFSRGTLVGADGTVIDLARDDVDIDVLDSWRSPRGEAVYPSRWRLRIPRKSLDLEARPALADQELDLGVRYWEGSVTVRGRTAAGTVEGTGYVELTGYADAPVSR